MACRPWAAFVRPDAASVPLPSALPAGLDPKTGQVSSEDAWPAGYEAEVYDMAGERLSVTENRRLIPPPSPQGGR